MKMIKKTFRISIVFLLLSFNLFAQNFNFSSPQLLTTAAGDIPTMTVGWDPIVITSASGKHVYASRWKTLAEKTKIFYSKDFGATWTNADPLETVFGDSVFPQLTTDLSGQYVSGIWADRLLGLPNIKIYYSKDFGAGDEYNEFVAMFYLI